MPLRSKYSGDQPLRQHLDSASRPWPSHVVRSRAPCLRSPYEGVVGFECQVGVREPGWM